MVWISKSAAFQFSLYLFNLKGWNLPPTKSACYTFAADFFIPHGRTLKVYSHKCLIGAGATYGGQSMGATEQAGQAEDYVSKQMLGWWSNWRPQCCKATLLSTEPPSGSLSLTYFLFPFFSPGEGWGRGWEGEHEIWVRRLLLLWCHGHECSVSQWWVCPVLLTTSIDLRFQTHISHLPMWPLLFFFFFLFLFHMPTFFLTSIPQLLPVLPWKGGLCFQG